MALTTSGIYSNINTEDIVSKLMQVERQPLVKLQQKEVSYQAKISSLGSLLSSIAGLKSAVTALKDSSVVGMKVTTGDANVLTATATTGASAANHSIKVNNIATAQSIYSTTFVNTTTSVADLSVVATQKLQIKVGSSDAVTITIDENNNSLTGVKDAINKAKAGVSASIVNDGTGNRLVLASNTTGADNRIVVKVDEDNNGTFEEASDVDNVGLSRLAINATYDADGNISGGIANMMQSQVAKNASLIVDGLAVTKSSNTLTDVIEGVSITLKKDSGGSTVSLNVTKDIDMAKVKINGFVNSYNSIMATIKDLTSTQGSIGSDATISSIKSAVRDVVTSVYDGGSLTLLGVTHDRNGVLSFNATTFDEELAKDEAGVVNMLNKMAAKLELSLDNYEKTVIPDKRKSYEATTKLLAQRQEALAKKLEKVETQLKKKFNNLDQMMAQLQGQSNYLTQQMNALNNSSNK